jgi:glycosyltransferase involved in cell wall biosynthesis
MAFCFSIIIIAKNEAVSLARTLQALQGLTDDLIVVENGSTDDTVAVATQNNAKVITTKWLGYGATKNFGAAYAKYDWVLSLDADEVVDKQLYQSLQAIQFTNINMVYHLQRYMMWQGSLLRFGGSVERKARLFHRQFAHWNDSEVHEQLVFADAINTAINIDGKLLHYSYINMQDAIKRNNTYAALDADKKFKAGKKYVLYLPKLRGWLEFIQVFIIKFGWLDGRHGWQYANTKQLYKQQKYQLLQAKYQA